jgi:hypothetical protein
MRASIVRAYSLGIITGSFLTAGVVLFATPAKADVDSASVAYAAMYGEAVCSTLDDYPNFDGILGIGRAIIEDGLSARQAGQVIGLSVQDICPRHSELMEAFINYVDSGATV